MPSVPGKDVHSHVVGSLLAPRSVAIIGASGDLDKYGGRLLHNLARKDFAGRIYPIHPSRTELMGLAAYPSVRALPEAVDVAIMAIPRDRVAQAVDDCASAGVKAVIVLTAKFSDGDAEGAALEHAMVARARQSGMRILGPNCLGVFSPVNRVVLSSSTALVKAELRPGQIGFISQSGALTGTLLDRATACGVRLSHAVSVGNQADLELCDFVEFMISDPATRVICTYIEGIKDAARFARLARAAREAGKPWLAVAVGRTAAGTRAAFSHTASVAGDRAVFEAVCREENVTLMNSPMAMLCLGASLCQHPGAQVSRIAVLSPSGGEAALAADEVAAAGLTLAQFSDASRARLAEHFTEGQAHNPVDFGGRKLTTSVNVAELSMDVLKADDNVDALLVAMTTTPTLSVITGEMADTLSAGSPEGTPAKPAVYLFELGPMADTARRGLIERGLWFTDHMGEAMEVLVSWGRRSAHQPVRPATRPPLCGEGAALPASGTLGEDAAKQLIALYGIPTNAAVPATDVASACAAAEALGYPVVMKVVSDEITHKSDVGGVVVGVADRAGVKRAWDAMHQSVAARAPGARIEAISVQAQVAGPVEIMIGARRDPQFGPVVVFGAGGVLVELLASVAIARAPASHEHVRALLATLPIVRILNGYRGARLHVDGVVDAIVRASWLAHDLRERDFELDINPLIVCADACCAVDARLRIG